MKYRWPNGARCVVMLTFDCDGPGNEIGRGLDPAGAHSIGRYSPRRGLPRVLEMADRQQIPITCFMCGHDAELHPEYISLIGQAKQEMAAHGYVHEGWAMPPDEEIALLRKTHRILSELSGTAPVGWRAPGGQKSNVTLPTLRELGYVYDTSDKDFDGPYPAVVGAGPSTEMVSLPNITSTLDDAYMYGTGRLSPEEILELWKGEFDALYHGAGYFVMTLHPRGGRGGSGVPGRLRAIDRLVSFIKTYPDVHFTNMRDLARWCLDAESGVMQATAHLGGRP
ncbi:MAG TPA: polysaccharide deacetylase family protein [Dehalococcoidia bacterium]|nr:polysaccharide deacetylase family protein [Dehalococcoidia bacterium]